MRAGAWPHGWTCVVLLWALTAPAAAQPLPVGDALEEYLRALELTGRVEIGSLSVRPLRLDDVRSALDAGPHPWSARLAPPPPRGPLRVSPTTASLRLFVNSSFPVGQNDGAVWQGKGLTTALDAGASAAWRGLSMTARPSLIHTRNARFDLAPVEVPNQPVYAYPFRRIDMPQRFGPDPLWTLDPGQSEIRLAGFGAAAAFGTTSLWWGPALRNAIVMSNHAAGFAHASLGTDGPVAIGVGELEVQWIWGDLDQSEWFDPALAGKDRFITGIVAAYSPSFLDGLSLGLTRVFYAWKPAEGVRDVLLVFQGVRKKAFVTPENPTGDDEHDQMISLFGRWLIAEGGFEVYWEWARNDHSADFRDFILQPAHSRGYTLGLQKALDLPRDRLLVLNVELTDLQKGSHLRATPTYYSHHIVVQGYTNRGQVMGAGFGPGGNSQHLGADLYAGWGRAGAYLRREVRDNDAYLLWAPNHLGKYWDHDVYLHLGTQALVFVHALEVGGGVVLTRELNRYFGGRDLWNLNLSLSAAWRPR